MADTIVRIAALGATCAGAACLYLGAPRQQWLTRSWPALPSRVGGALFMLTGLLLWMQCVHPSSALFTMLASCMMLFITLPYLAALRTLLKGG